MTTTIEDISALIERRTGLSVMTRFRTDFQFILNELAEGNLADFLARLHESRENDPTWQNILQALTIGETYFFRDSINFRLLRERVLPDLIQRRRDQHQRQLNIWCAGCSTGEEPYSVAITLYQMLSDLQQWQVNIVGTDINQDALEQARTGIYRHWAFRHNDSSVQQRYFDPVAGGWQLRPHIREMVRFQQGNLLHGPPLPRCDVIFCRNVLIYLTRAHVAELETMVYNTLAPGGWLVLGQAEAIRVQRERWITHIFPGSVLYQKPVEQAAAIPVLRHHRQPAASSATAELPAAENADRYDAAVTALYEDHSDEAERLLGEMLSMKPGHAAGRTLLAYIFANRQATPEAHTQLDIALRNDPMWSDAHYLRATLHLETGQTAEAERALRAALYCQRDHPLATFTMGNLLAQAGDRKRACRAWQAAYDLVDKLPPESRISDLSDMTAATFKTLIQTQLDTP